MACEMPSASDVFDEADRRGDEKPRPRDGRLGDEGADQVDPERLAVGLISGVAVAHLAGCVRQFGDTHGNQIRSFETDPDMTLDKSLETLRRLLIRMQSADALQAAPLIEAA